MKHRLFAISFALLAWFGASAQRHVTQERMQEIYDEVRTPYKYGMVVAPDSENAKIDCPTVFREGDRWYMTYVVYNGRGGLDGRGYETWLAESDNLLEWRTLGRLLSYRDKGWDMNQRGGFPSLIDMEWGGSYALQSYRGRRWMTYIGGAGTGYEAVNGPLAVGLAWTKGDAATAHEWQTAAKPILSIADKDVQWWEALTEYKSMVYWDRAETLGAPFVLYYNAGGVHLETGLKGERIGIALSDDMRHWRRYAGNPVFAHEAQGTITGDAQIQRIGDVYVMFYFSAFNPDRNYKAFNTFACSYDLVTWDDWQGDDLIWPTKDYDAMFAHKSFVVKHDGVVYHFYCAVNDAEQRGIAVATSRPMGRSAVKFPAASKHGRRGRVDLDKGWTTWIEGGKPVGDTLTVDIPHNWDDYYGARQLTHGNLHGTAIYRKQFEMPDFEGRHCFLRLEGVGTYATVTLNGRDLGRHPVGRTTLTLDIAGALRTGSNTLEIKAEHPEMITDMPWVCGGCSSEWGFSEGSQPLGLFRPVWIEVTDQVRIEPFGVHVWNSDDARTVCVDTEIRNYTDKPVRIQLVNKLSNMMGSQTFRLTDSVSLAAGEVRVVRQQAEVESPHLWSTGDPYLYSLATMIKRDNRTVDEVTTPFGIRTVSWPVKRTDGDGRFYLNGEPVFINGICEYEHLFGASHSFTSEQIASRVKQMKNAGFNAFRDAHQPHNLEYQGYWDREGILFWPQFSAHIWYDTPEFRANFIRLLRQWVKERRNSPSVVMWGLQNESVLPRGFAEECCRIIREMDPTAERQRVITTCNGGEGTDWNVIQNWSGTYGGDPENYGTELSQPNQLLNGEYGAWRTLGLHAEAGAETEGWSEESMCRILETKIRRAEEAAGSVCGHFQWLYNSHDNPGRKQPDEALRRIDKTGPFNYKGLVTPWEEPTDSYYLYRGIYTDPRHDPMVYIVSHTWPERFADGPRSTTIDVYSNCDSVALYNGAGDSTPLGVRRRGGTGTHFTWSDCPVRYNTLRAVGYCGGRAVAEDVVIFNGLERPADFGRLYDGATDIVKGDPQRHYIYRINCGGDAYTDTFGQQWSADSEAICESWAAAFGLDPRQVSQRRTDDPIRGTRDWELFRTFRFGRHKLRYRLPLPDGDYRVELYFTEPWHGTGSGTGGDFEGLRIFDAAANGHTIVDDLDIWAECGHDCALRRTADVRVEGGELVIDFPEVKAGQAVISAIAVSAAEPVDVAPLPEPAQSWAEAGRDLLPKLPAELLPEEEPQRQTATYEAEDAAVSGKHTVKEWKKQQGVFFGPGEGRIEWTVSTGLAQVYALRFKYMNLSGRAVEARMRLTAPNGAVLRDDTLTIPDTPEKWRVLSTTTGTYINAGTYRITIDLQAAEGVAFDALDVQ